MDTLLEPWTCIYWTEYLPQSQQADCTVMFICFQYIVLEAYLDAVYYARSLLHSLLHEQMCDAMNSSMNASMQY